MKKRVVLYCILTITVFTCSNLEYKSIGYDKNIVKSDVVYICPDKCNNCIALKDSLKMYKIALEKERKIIELIYMGGFDDGMLWQREGILHVDSFHNSVRKKVGIEWEGK